MIRTYVDINDFELLNLISENNEEAETIIFDKYKPVIEMKSRKYQKLANSLGIEVSDLIQEGMIGLSQAMNDFKDYKDVKFSTFANLCIEREILAAITKANRKKHKLLNESISLDYTIDDDQNTIGVFIADNDASSPEQDILDKESLLELKAKLNSVLTDNEWQVFELKSKGFGYKQIAVILDKSPKSIDNTLQRIKKKIKSYTHK